MKLTHGFDNHGRKFDKDGNMRDWWGNSSAQAFETKAKCMVDQYSKYKIGNSHVSLPRSPNCRSELTPIFIENGHFTLIKIQSWQICWAKQANVWLISAPNTRLEMAISTDCGSELNPVSIENMH